MAVRNISGRAAQTVIGTIVLAGLVAVAAGIYVKQFHYDPTIYQPPAEPDAPAGAARFADLLPGALEAKTPAESFDADTLFQKINGKDEQYLSAGFVRLDCQRFQLVGQPDLWLELFVYDMGEATNVFAVYSAQRRDDAEPTDLAKHAYWSEGRLFLAHGRYYVEILPVRVDVNLVTATVLLATNFVVDAAVEAAGEDVTLLFPPEGLVPDSIGLLVADAFGCAGLDNVYVALYRVDETTVTAFLSQRSIPDDAKAMAETYISYLKELGASEQDVSGLVPGRTVSLALDGYRYLIFHKGTMFGGVSGPADSAATEALGYRIFEVFPEADE